MMLRRLRIEHFRGIESTEWAINGRLVGLVGACDGTKTTLLDAIGLVLNPNSNLQFTDSDFFGFDLTKNIVIEAVVSDLPDNLVKESQLGKDRSGIMPDGMLVHDPIDEAEERLVVRLTVTPELDPMWEVVRPGSDDARPISASQRRQLGFFRLGERPDFHLRWARGSALSGLTVGTDGASSVILDAHREARAAVFNAQPNALHAALLDTPRKIALTLRCPVHQPTVPTCYNSTAGRSSSAPTMARNSVWGRPVRSASWVSDTPTLLATSTARRSSTGCSGWPRSPGSV
jgi:hypothetical protein